MLAGSSGPHRRVKPPCFASRASRDRIILTFDEFADHTRSTTIYELFSLSYPLWVTVLVSPAQVLSTGWVHRTSVNLPAEPLNVTNVSQEGSVRFTSLVSMNNKVRYNLTSNGFNATSVPVFKDREKVKIDSDYSKISRLTKLSSLGFECSSLIPFARTAAPRAANPPARSTQPISS